MLNMLENNKTMNLSTHKFSDKFSVNKKLKYNLIELNKNYIFYYIYIS